MPNASEDNVNKTKSTSATWKEFVKLCPRIIIILCYSFQIIPKLKMFWRRLLCSYYLQHKTLILNWRRSRIPKNFFWEETNKSTTSTISVKAKRCNRSWLKGLQKDLVAISLVRGNMKNGTHSERRLLQRRHCFLSSVLLELEKSDALFKHTIPSHIDLLQTRMGRVYLFEHISTLDIDLGVTNAQCTRFECLDQPLHLIGSTPQGANDYTTQPFSVYDEDTFIDTSFR